MKKTKMGVMRGGILRGVMMMSIMSLVILRCSSTVKEISIEKKQAEEEEMGMEEEQVDVDWSAKDIKKDIKIGGGDNS